MDISTLFSVAGSGVALLTVAGAVASRYKIANPTQALIITGRNKGKEQKVVIGSGSIVIPFFQKCTTVDLRSIEIPINIESVPSSDGILLDVEATAVIKIDGTAEAVRASAQRFEGGNHDTIKQQSIETLSGALRNIVASLEVRELIQNRERFSNLTVESAQTTLNDQGLHLDTFQIRSISDRGDYLTNLGREEQARQRSNAQIVESENERKALEKRLSDRQISSNLYRESMLVESENMVKREVAQAEAEAAKPLAAVKQEQLRLKEEAEAATLKALVREKELEATVKKQADAERYESEQRAEARKLATILDAEAEAQKKINDARAKAEEEELLGKGRVARATADRQAKEAEAEANLYSSQKRAEGIKAEAQAQAEQVQKTGQAEASVILAKGEAEAEAMTKRAEAFKQYGEVAVVEIVGDVMKDVAKSMSGAYANIDNITIMGGGDNVGKFGNSLTSAFAEVKQAVKDGAGLDLDKLVNDFMPKEKETDFMDSPVNEDVPLNGEVVVHPESK